MLKRTAHHAHRTFLILKNGNLPSLCLQPLLWMSNLCPHHEGEDSGSKVQKFMISGLQIPSGCSSKTAPSLTSGTMKYKYQVEKLRAAWDSFLSIFGGEEMAIWKKCSEGKFQKPDDHSGSTACTQLPTQASISPWSSTGLLLADHAKGNIGPESLLKSNSHHLHLQLSTFPAPSYPSCRCLSQLRCWKIFWILPLYQMGVLQIFLPRLHISFLLMCSLLSHSIMFNSLQTHRLLCLWDFQASKNTGVGCHFLFQGIFPT